MISAPLPGVYLFSVGETSYFTGDMRADIVSDDFFQKLLTEKFFILKNGLLVEESHKLVHGAGILDPEINLRIDTICPEDLLLFLERMKQKGKFSGIRNKQKKEFSEGYIFPNKFEYMTSPTSCAMLHAYSSEGAHRFFVSPAGQVYEEDVAFRNEMRDSVLFSATGGAYEGDIEAETARRRIPYDIVGGIVRAGMGVGKGAKALSGLVKKVLDV
jgi:hypothetical protein